MLARWAGVPQDEVDYVCAGINHMAFYVKFQHKGKDLYPKLRQVVRTDKKVYNEEQVRNEMFIAMDYYVTESSGHNSEYNWWFRKRPDLIEKYCTHGTGWNPGEYAYIVTHYKARDKGQQWKKDVREWLNKEKPMSLDRGLEYAAYIINAWQGGEPFEFHGNVRNTGLVTNLPPGCCVEVPVVARRNDLLPVHVGALPAQCAILCGLSAQTEMMAVEGCLTGDAKLIYQAIAHDPLTASVLSLAEARKMTLEMFKKNKPYLPQFKKIDF